MRVSQPFTIAGHQISGQQVKSAGSLRLNEGDRVQVRDTYPGPAELRGQCGKITKNRGLGRFHVVLENKGESAIDGCYLNKI
jgi:hypothetical protein